MCSTYLECIQQVLGHNISNPIIHLQGDEHDIYEINKTWIFRFAKDQSLARHMKVEVNLLDFLERKINYTIPKVEFYFKHIAGMCYRKIKGALFSQELYLSWPNECKTRFVTDLARFLLQLHQSATNKDIRKLQLDASSWPLLPDQLYPLLAKKLDATPLHPLFAQFHQEYISLLKATESTVLVHNDLHPDNLLVDETSGKLLGVLDFSSACIGDPYLDFRLLLSVDHSLVKDIIREYAKAAKKPPDLHRTYLYYLATEYSRLHECLERKDHIGEFDLITNRIIQCHHSSILFVK